MKRSIYTSLLTLALLVAGTGNVKAEDNANKNYLSFKTESYCAATWNASTNTFTWGSGGANPEWVFMAADGISGDLSDWTLLHLHVSDFKNASARQLRVVFRKNDGSWPPNGPTKEFVVSPDASGNIDIALGSVSWGACDITNIQDLTIYGCARDDNTKDASVKITDAYYVSEGGPINKVVNITVGGKTRYYRLYVPKGCQAGAPLVVAMHGASGSMNDQSPRFNDIADTEKFVVAYPHGEEIYFPVFGGTVTGWDASGEDNADAAFIRAVVDDLAQDYQIDRKRVYCCGFSNGGMNTYAMANVCSDVFAAFASISGFPLNEFHLRHTGSRPVPFLHIHGKGDSFVNYALMPVIVDEMVARMGANPVPVKTSVSGKYDKSVYQATEGSFPYIYYEINDMAHVDFTANTEDGNSSLTMWKFFKQYTLDDAYDAKLRWRPRIEETGFEPQQHGWTVNDGTTLLAFGEGAKTNANQNVYHSMQFVSGTYKLSFNSTGASANTVSVRIQKLTGSKQTVLNKTVNVNEPSTMFFKIEDGWGEYQITFVREHATDATTIKDISIETSSDEEAAGITTLEVSQPQEGSYYSLNGMKVSRPSKGVYINNGKKIVIP